MKALALAVMLVLLASACGDAAGTAEPTPTAVTTTIVTTSAPAPTQATTGVLLDTASAVADPPADMTDVNSMHDALRSENSKIQFGTHADPGVITLGPTDGGIPVIQPYKGKNSMNIRMPLNTEVLAPLEMTFVGFDNRSAHGREGQSPYDDLEICFESASPDWPDMVICVYHLRTSPLLPGHLVDEECGPVEEWTGSQGSNAAGRIMFLKNETFFGKDRPAGRDPKSCRGKIGSLVQRGEIIGYSGQVGNNPHSGFRFKVMSENPNPLTLGEIPEYNELMPFPPSGDPYLHWVQPSVFFYWQCFEPDAVFQPGVLAYPFDCEPIRPPLAMPTTVGTTVGPTTPAAPTTVAPAGLFKPSLEERYEVSVEEAVVYGTGGTLDGGQVELLLDLAIPDTGTDGPRPLFVHIHGGGFIQGSRSPHTAREVAKRGWVAASIDYRLAGDEPLPGQRVQGFFDAMGGESSSARDRSVVAAAEDTLVALDYLLSRADELHIDTNRIVLKGESAGAFTALAVAYCADKFEVSGPKIAAVIDFAGGIPETFCGGATAIDPGEAAVFVVHGTEDTGETSFTRALSIVDGATAAEITYEFHPQEGVGHNVSGATTADGRAIDDAMYEFLNRVLYGEQVATTPPTDTVTQLTDALATLPAFTLPEIGPSEATSFDPKGLLRMEVPFIPLDNPVPVTAATATWLRPDDFVLGVERGGEARAYPISQIAYHHLVNDTIAGEPYLVTY